MNIFIDVEISARELDSKLLLAVLAASRGHEVLISEKSAITKGAKSGALSPGVLHTKALTPHEKRITRHHTLVDKGFLITSIDEEGGLIDYGYDKFAKLRYSQESIGQAAAVFGWGTEDTVTLQRLYPHSASKIHQTGSPRADLWKPRFCQFWDMPKGMPKKPFLLVSSNMGSANNMRPFHKRLQNADYDQHHPKLLSRRFGEIAESYRMTLAFIEAIRHLAAATDEYDIVLRPHPVENIEAWRVYLKGVPNVHVIREDSITAWVNYAFAVMHNSCTTALEATVSNKPLLTYVPFSQDYAREIPNELGVRVESLDALPETVDEMLNASRSCGTSGQTQELPESVAKKIYFDDEELAAEKIIKAWEALDNGGLSRRCNWTRLKAHVRLRKIKRVVGSMLRNKPSRGNFRPANDNYKFPPMDARDIRDRVCRLQDALGLDVELECKLLAERSVLIRRLRD